MGTIFRLHAPMTHPIPQNHHHPFPQDAVPKHIVDLYQAQLQTDGLVFTLKGPNLPQGDGDLFKMRVTTEEAKNAWVQSLKVVLLFSLASLSLHGCS